MRNSPSASRGRFVTGMFVDASGVASARSRRYPRLGITPRFPVPRGFSAAGALLLGRPPAIVPATLLAVGEASPRRDRRHIREPGRERPGPRYPSNIATSCARQNSHWRRLRVLPGCSVSSTVRPRAVATAISTSWSKSGRPE